MAFKGAQVLILVGELEGSRVAPSCYTFYAAEEFSVWQPHLVGAFSIVSEVHCSVCFVSIMLIIDVVDVDQDVLKNQQD